MKLEIQEGHFGDNEKIVPILAQDIEQSLDVMKKEGIKNLAINSQWGGGSIKKLDFLHDNQWIEGVMIVDNNVDIGPVNALNHLKRLNLPDRYTGVLDFKNIPGLERLFCRWNKKQLKNLGTATNLQWAWIFWINEVDMLMLKDLRKLKRFDTVYSKIQSLHGIENWESLEKLVLSKLPRLADVTALEKLAGHIKDFRVDSCKSLTDYSFLKKLTAMDTVCLGAGPPIQSVEFFKDLNLTSGFVGVEVLDKKLDVLDRMGIEYWKYKSYKS
jgi:hypothetical protein